MKQHYKDKHPAVTMPQDLMSEVQLAAKAV